MPSFHTSWSSSFPLIALAFTIISKSMAQSYGPPAFRPSPWQLAHATFYGDETASETMGMWNQ
ncbi:putative Alpha-expansin 7 precursor [Tripterygium wilfordii]|uniref:Putative Alpha-expansin 7 n=1 Tax=Tripterygium wilfordii TaxID=458696 RepID=A0A7J7C719_TRIWF|nr:putative Alpha-expansin 7 precursor [Tripterygium wilfordii]